MAANTVWIAAIAGVVGTALGAISGALISGWLNYRTEKRRWEREDRNRHYTERLRVYTEFYKAAEKRSHKSWSDLVDDLLRDPKDVPESHSQLRRALEDLYPQIAMIASEPVRDAAGGYMRAVHNRGPSIHKLDDLLKDLQDTDRKMDEFVAAAREELGVSVGRRTNSSQPTDSPKRPSPD